MAGRCDLLPGCPCADRELHHAGGVDIYANTHYAVDEPYAVACITANATDKRCGVITRDVRVNALSPAHFSYWWYHALTDDQVGTPASTADVSEGAAGTAESCIRNLLRSRGVQVIVGAVHIPERPLPQLMHFPVAVASADFTKGRGFHELRYGAERVHVSPFMKAGTLFAEVSRDEAVLRAQTFRRGLAEAFPADAALESAKPMYYARGRAHPVVMGYHLQYSHRWGGCRIEGDWIRMTVVGDCIVAYSERWHRLAEVLPGQDGRATPTRQHLSADQIVACVQSVVADPHFQVLRRLGFGRRITSVEIVYDTLENAGGVLGPRVEIVFDNRAVWIVDLGGRTVRRGGR